MCPRYVSCVRVVAILSIYGAVIVVCLIAATAKAVVVWDEGVDGDLSGDRLNPTSLALVLGSNTLTATSVGGTSADREYVHFSMPGGTLLSAIVSQAYAGQDGTAFIGVQSGATFTEPPTGTNVANLLGYSHFGSAVQPIGTNILPAIGTGDGSIGFTPPLPGGDYTFWIQQTSSTSPATYTFDFVVVPEPSTAALVGLGTAALLVAIRRRRRIFG